ncbi:MAG: DinB family protein [Gammaproteobacteria bacterium]|nr:DinB family protein [Gammaproteobacteria bacterium]
MKLEPAQREALLAALDAMPRYLSDAFSGLTSDRARTPGADGSFAPVEQVWHLADLEREGFGPRIEKLLSEHEPRLPDFDGTTVAAARRYRELSLERGLSAFAEARRRNLAKLRTIAPDAWTRGGTQEGVGRVSLCDIPGFMSQHDASHRAEIEAWKKQRA